MLKGPKRSFVVVVVGVVEKLAKKFLNRTKNIHEFNLFQEEQKMFTTKFFTNRTKNVRE